MSQQQARRDHGPLGEVFDVRFSAWKLLRSSGILLAMALSVGCLAVASLIPWWLATASGVLLLLVVVIGVAQAICVRGLAPAMRLDPTGVTVTGGPTVPWSDLTGVRLMTMRPKWLVGGRRHHVVAFLPRLGVQLPGPPGLHGRPYAPFASMRRRTYGTNLLVQTLSTEESATEIAAAAHRLSGLPVVVEPVVRPVRRWLVLLGLAMAAGVVAAVVTTLLDL